MTNCTPTMLYAKDLTLEGKSSRTATLRYAFQGDSAPLKVKATFLAQSGKSVPVGVIGRTMTRDPSGSFKLKMPKRAGQYSLQLVLDSPRCSKLPNESSEFVSLTVSK